MSEKDRYAYYETAKRLGREEGLEQGLQKGHAEGLQEGTISIARKFKSMGLPVEQIIHGTGLSTEQIAAL